jgi:hypothetical protein
MGVYARQVRKTISQGGISEGQGIFFAPFFVAA